MPLYIASPEALSTVELVLRLGVALGAGLLVGFERELRGKSAGLRTHALVALSSAALTVFAIELAGPVDAAGERDPLRVTQGVAQAIGLICTGMIIQGRAGGVRNLTTAATLWAVAVLGMVCGGGYWLIAGLTALGVMLTLLMGRFVVGMIPHTGED